MYDSVILGNKIVNLNEATGKRFVLTNADFLGLRQVMLDGKAVSPPLKEDRMTTWLDACLFGFNLGNFTDWQCPRCDNMELRVSNDSLAENGPPMCTNCDCEMI